MRALVFLLILANLLFFAWTQGYLGNTANPDALRLQQQLLAESQQQVSDVTNLLSNALSGISSYNRIFSL